MADLDVRRYHLAPTSLVPNSPLPLLHYPGYFLPRNGLTESSDVAPTRETSFKTPQSISKSAADIAVQSYTTLAENGWQTQWIYRYGPTQESHYHSEIHECMVVLSGTARIRFGLEDEKNEKYDLPEHVEESPKLGGSGLILDAGVGDVFILPAGTAHKTFDVTAGSTFTVLTPGDGHSLVLDDVEKENASDNKIDPIADSTAQHEKMLTMLSRIEFSGFTMLGAYPTSDSRKWDFMTGGEFLGRFEDVWNTPIPERDPILGNSTSGLCSSWRSIDIRSHDIDGDGG